MVQKYRGWIGSRTSIDAIRYYERLGLLAKPARSNGGFRLYSKKAIGRIRFIRKAQALGLTLREIREIMVFSEEGLKPCCDLVRRLFTLKIVEFESKIRKLQVMKLRLKVRLSEWVSPREARKRTFAVCPQIEQVRSRDSTQKRGGFNSAR